MTALEKKINTTIRLTADVKQYLDEMKGSVSASEFIETMLSYFERNGVDPRTSINGKFKTLELQGIERIIKIIRAIEKDKIDKLLPASESHSDDLLKQADKQVTQLKAEVERLKKASAPDVVGRNKLGQVVRLLENAFDQKNFKKAEKGTDYFVAPVYLEMLLYKVTKRMISADSFATSTAVSTEMPISADFIAAASLMPSPIKPTVCPFPRRTETTRDFWSGVSFAKTSVVSAAFANS